MPASRLLFLDANSLTAYRWQSGKLKHEGEFTPDPAGLEAFGEFVARSRSSLFYILADVAEEGFQTERAPFTRGSDRGALIKRRLGQNFFGTPYSLACSLGREKDGRRDERLLLTALTRPEQIEPWLGILRSAEGQLAGVFSLPLASPDLPSLLGVSAQRFLLITITRAGLRQTLFDNGQVNFSRLTPLATGSTEEMAATCAIESEKMHQYMAGQRLITRGSQLSTQVLVHPAQLGAFREACADTAAIHFEFVDLLGLSAKVGLHTPPKDTHAEALFLHLLAKRPPREQFAPEADRHHFRLGQLRFGLRAAGYVLFSACVLFAGRQAFEYQTITQRSADIAAQTTSDRQRYDAILQGLPKIPISNDALRALVARYDTLSRKTIGPEPLYILVSQALHDSPRVELKRLDWVLGTSKEGKAVAPISAKATPAAIGAAPARPERSTPGVPTFESAEIEATLPLGLSGDHRAQIAAVDGFVGQLRAQRLEVQTLNMPFDSESTKSLKSRADGAAQAQAPQFSVRVSRSIP